MKKPPTVRSTVTIARILGSDGFNEHTASLARGYWKRVVANQSDRSQRRLDSIERAFKESVGSQLTDTQKQILGKFISIREKAAFDTGFRVGFMTTMFPEKESS